MPLTKAFQGEKKKQRKNDRVSVFIDVSPKTI